MDRAEVLSRLEDIFADVMDIDAPGLTEASKADDFEEWDSLSNIRFVVAVERGFKVKFTNSEIEGMKNVGDLVTTILAKAG
ncbi:MAG: acyl carrier protein [Sphingomonadaceae bacterium]